MSLLQKIQEDVKTAMKEKQEEKLKALRMLTAAIKNEEIDKRPEPLKEEDVLNVIKREVKKLNDSIAQFKEGGREDLADSYAAEAKILQEYLPEQMSEEELKKIVKEKVAASEDKNFGMIMKAVMAETKGSADGSLVSKLVKEELEN